jgi:hypothetical protein
VNFSQLRKQAEQLNIPDYTKMRKAELEEAIAAAQVTQAQTLRLNQSVPLQ